MAISQYQELGGRMCVFCGIYKDLFKDAQTEEFQVSNKALLNLETQETTVTQHATIISDLVCLYCTLSFILFSFSISQFHLKKPQLPNLTFFSWTSPNHANWHFSWTSPKHLQPLSMGSFHPLLYWCDIGNPYALIPFGRCKCLLYSLIILSSTSGIMYRIYKCLSF